MCLAGWPELVSRTDAETSVQFVDVGEQVLNQPQTSTTSSQHLSFAPSARRVAYTPGFRLASKVQRHPVFG